MAKDSLARLRADMEARFALLAAMPTKVTMLEGEVGSLKNVVQQMGPPFVTSPVSRLLQGGLLMDKDGQTYRVLPDGTKQFPNAPTGTPAPVGSNVTPPVPVEMGVGAVVRVRGLQQRMTVDQVGDGLVFCVWFDQATNEGPQRMPFMATQLEVVTAAPV